MRDNSIALHSKFLRGRCLTHVVREGAHQAQASLTPQRIIEWAKKTGPSTAALVEEIMKRRVHPQ